MARVSQSHMFVIILLSALAVVEADPNCATFEEGSVVCTPGDTDYVLKGGLVSDNNKTTNITLSACRITELGPGAFKGLLSLQYLDLSRNAISEILFGTLDEPMPGLKHLNLSYNKLVSFRAGVLLATKNLEVLDLRGNNVMTISVLSEWDLVQDIVTNIRYFDIADNGFITGSGANELNFLFSGTVRYLDMSGCNGSAIATVTGNNYFSWGEQLEVLHLDRCNFSKVSNINFTPLKAVKHLTLSSNRFDRIQTTTFEPLISLEILDLSENEIDMIENDAFLNNENLMTLNLTKNKLKVLTEDVFRALPKLINLDLSNNLIADVPIGAFRSSPLRVLNLAGNQFTYLPEYFCLKLKYSRASLTKFDFSNNPWQCACLHDILTEVKMFAIEYTKVDNDGKFPVCGFREGFVCEREKSLNDLNIGYWL